MLSISYKPTRMELIAFRRRKKLAERGLSLLKEKQDALVMELIEFLREYRTLKEEVDRSVSEAYRRLVKAKMELGSLKVIEIAVSSLPRYDVKLRSRSVMGVKTPSLTLVTIADVNRPTYSLIHTSSSLDETVRAFHNALSYIIRLAEVEVSIKRIAEELKKAKRRVNALETAIIPRIDVIIKNIELYLDERAREDVFRVRMLKRAREKELIR